MSLDVRIEEMVLRGFPAVDRELLVSAIASELERLVELEGMPLAPAHSLTGRRLVRGTVRRQSADDTPSLGTEIGRAIYDGIVRTDRGPNGSESEQ